ncbi:hypothetical protein OOZ53_03390 [Hoeflea sp. E7-10]|uniref:Uncharacterized protein n=1 Tax=Hoeflea poritis TaxID=2993659 RepID=A0ABT4VIE8_9HYPH|nr:hypothetical protein [Hoeflea poritis]
MHGLQAEAFWAAQGLQGLQTDAFLAAHGLHGLQAAGFFAAHGLAAHEAVLGVDRPADKSSVPPAAPASANGTTATVVNNLDLIVAIKHSSALPVYKRRLGFSSSATKA